MTKQQFTVEQLAQFIQTQTGKSPEEAMADAQKVFANAQVEQVTVPTEPATEPKEAPVQETPSEQAPVEQAPVEATIVQETKMDKVKGWFRSASEKLSFSSKDVLAANLVMEKIHAKTQEEKDEIQAFIDRLTNKDSEGFYKEKVEPAVAKIKGWSIDGSVKLADSVYLVGDYAGKGATGLTKAVGKTTQLVGEGITKTGKFVEDNADTVGKVVESPFKLTGDAINTLNGTKKSK